MTAQEVIAKTRALFAETHWAQGHMRMQSGDKVTYCLVGGLRETACGSATALPEPEVAGPHYADALIAINKVLVGTEEDCEEETLEHNIALSKDEDGNIVSFEYLEDWLIGFNDNSSRTLDEVLAVLDKAAELVPAGAAS